MPFNPTPPIILDIMCKCGLHIPLFILFCNKQVLVFSSTSSHNKKLQKPDISSNRIKHNGNQDWSSNPSMIPNNLPLLCNIEIR
jgi:hypothetical protein